MSAKNTPLETTICGGASGPMQFASCGPAGLPTLSPGRVQRQLRIMDETLLSIRDAAKCSKITGSKAELDRLADDVDAHARRVMQLSIELREAR